MASAIPIKGKSHRGVAARSPISPGSLPASCSSGLVQLPSSDLEIFNFKPELVEKWAMADELWNQLPGDLKDTLTKTQHAGAAVLSGLERLEKVQNELPDEEAPSTSLQNATASDAITAKLEEHVALINNRPNRPRRLDSEVFNCSPIPTRPPWLGSIASSRSAGSSSGTNSTGYVSPAARRSPPSVMSPASQDFFPSAMTPFELGESRLPTYSRRDSEIALAKSNIARRDSDLFSGMTCSTGSQGSNRFKLKAPKHPKSTMYYAELEELRQRELVRLRHSQRPVILLWSELKREAPLVQNELLRKQFEEWWTETKRKITSLDEHIKGLCAGIHFSVGWSDTPGLDHRYVQSLSY